MSGPVKRSGTSFEVNFVTFIFVLLGVQLLLYSLAGFRMVKLSLAMEAREKAQALYRSLWYGAGNTPMEYWGKFL